MTVKERESGAGARRDRSARTGPGCDLYESAFRIYGGGSGLSIKG
jgi:hypothetical protein